MKEMIINDEIMKWCEIMKMNNDNESNVKNNDDMS